jgi:hypothetical protein
MICAPSSVIHVPDNPVVPLPTDVVARNMLNAVIRRSGLQSHAPMAENVFSSEEFGANEIIVNV